MRTVLALCCAALCAFAPAACSDDPPRLSHLFVRQVRHAPLSLDLRSGRGPSAVRAGDGRLYVVAYGSDGCPELPTSVQAIGRHQVSVTTQSHSRPDAGCAADSRSDVSLIRLPRGVDRHAPLAVEVDNRVTHLPAN